MLDFGDVQTEEKTTATPLAGRLAHALRDHVIPRLHHRYGVDPPGATGIDAQALARACATGATGADMRGVLRTLREGGATSDAILFHWLPALARDLGRFWAEDSMSFVDVTIGMGRIERAALALGDSAPGGETGSATDSATDSATGPLAVVSPPPRAQHRFGALLVGIALRRAGWQVLAGPFGSDAALTAAVAAQPCRLFALSVGSSDEFPRARALIRAARAARPGLTVLAGGAAFPAGLDPVQVLGADAGAADARAITALAAGFRQMAGA